MSKSKQPPYGPIVREGSTPFVIDAHAKVRAGLAESYERTAAAMSAPAAVAEPAWVGWVYRLEGKDGYQRCKVRIPLSMLDDVRVGLPTGPDLRSNLVAQQTAEATSDAFLMEMSRESQK